MRVITFIVGIERFNASIWGDVRQRLAGEGADVLIRQFHDAHVDAADPQLAESIKNSDVVFISLINMRSQADWLARELEHSRATAIFAYESMPEVMALTRVGEHRFKEKKGEAPKAVKFLMRLITRGRDEDTLYAYTKLVKVAAKMLPLIPQKLSGFRTWLGVNLYWNQPDVRNITEMVKLILKDCFAESLNVAPVSIIPTMGCWDPQSGTLFDDVQSYLKWAKKTGRYKKGQPLVALMGMRKHVVQNLSYLRDLVKGIESRGFAALPIFVSGIEAHVAVREWLIGQPIDVFVSTMGFSIVGGPASSTKPGHHHETASDLLSALDVPYLVVQPLLMQSESEWKERGVASMQSVVMYDLPEMDGVASTIALGAIKDGELTVVPDRLERALEQIEGWVRLRHKPAAQRRVAIVLYNFPPGLGKAGTAALLDVPASVTSLLRRLKAEGYDIGEAATEQQAFATQLESLSSGTSSVALTLNDFRKLVVANIRDRIDQFWGSAPGDIAPAGRESMRLDVRAFGNVTIGLQPPMGVPGDPMRLLFDRRFTPHHQFVGFYAWLKKEWKADAIIHVGMHGTAEWMPGLQAALTADCWSDQLLGGVPHLYLYPLNNPSEAAVARRRGYATVISHAIPPYARAGTYKQLAEAQRRVSDPSDSLESLLPELPRQVDESIESYRDRVSGWIAMIEERLISDGLHVFGQSPEPEKARALIEAALEVPRQGRAGFSALCRSLGLSQEQTKEFRALFVSQSVFGRENALRLWTSTIGGEAPSALLEYAIESRKIVDGIAQCSGELDAVVHALNGRFIRPAYGADPVRTGAGALPSGRNIHGIDPWRLPTDSALERGRRMADMLVRRHHERHGSWPRTIGQTLWAMDTIKSEGETLGVVLALVGAEPERDGQGKIFRFRLTPLESLARPRIDVLLDVSAVFRDTFQMSLDLLDTLFREACLADEPVEQNFLRANTLDFISQGRSQEDATARVFSQPPGQYGNGVDAVIDESQWEGKEQLADLYQQRTAFMTGGSRAGREAPEVLRGLLDTVDHVFQAIDSVEYGLTDMTHYYGHSGALRLAAKTGRDASIPLTYAESFTGEVRLNDSDELLKIEARAKILNPKWFEGMLAHGHSGAAEIGNRFTHLLGWGALAEVDQWVFDGAAQTYLFDESVRKRLEESNPQAIRNAVSRLLEANGRGIWQTDQATLDRLQAMYSDIEDRLEGVSAAA
jgi:magnesium chelatase subunit H